MCFQRNECTQDAYAFDTSDTSSTRTPIVALFPRTSEVGRSRNESRPSDRAGLKMGPKSSAEQRAVRLPPIAPAIVILNFSDRD